MRILFRFGTEKLLQAQVTNIAPERVREDVKAFEGWLQHAAQQANLQGFVGVLTPHPQGVVAAANGFEDSQFVYERDG